MLAAWLLKSGHKQQHSAAAKISTLDSATSQPPTPTTQASALAAPNNTDIRYRMARMAISPRSANYERLEGGLGPSRMPAKRFAWKKFAIGAAAIIGLVWFFGPRESRTFKWRPQDSECVILKENMNIADYSSLHPQHRRRHRTITWTTGARTYSKTIGRYHGGATQS